MTPPFLLAGIGLNGFRAPKGSSQQKHLPPENIPGPPPVPQRKNKAGSKCFLYLHSVLKRNQQGIQLCREKV